MAKISSAKTDDASKFYQCLQLVSKAILVDKDCKEAWKLGVSEDMPVNQFIFARIASRNSKLADENCQSFLSTIQSTPIDKDVAFILMAKSLPKCSSVFCKKWA